MVALRLAKESDFSLIIDWANAHDADFITQWAGLAFHYPLTIEQILEHYSSGINSIESGVFIYMIHNDHLKDESIGTIQFVRLNTVTKDAYIGRFMIRNEKLRGQGLGKQTLNEMLRIGFEEFGLEEIKLNVFDFNERAIRCYESVGFRKGKVKKCLQIK